ncbi:MAG TPA: hypothetical protein VF988_09075 [Verrucomicrobiae bacterium]
MPAVSTGFAAGTVPAAPGGSAIAPAQAVKSAAGADHQPLAGEGDFDRLMQARLGAGSHQGKGKPPLAAQDPALTGLGSAAAEPILADNSAGAGRTSAKENPSQKDLTMAPDDKNVAEKGAPFIAPENSQSLPAYFSLPLLLNPAVGDGSVAVAARPATVLVKISGTPMAPDMTIAPTGAPENSPADRGLNSATLKSVSPNATASPTVQAPADTSVNSPRAESAPGKDPMLPPTSPTPSSSAQPEPTENNPSPISQKDLPAPTAMTEDGRHNGAATDTGMGVAINAVSMKNPQKANKVAEPNAQVLPVGNSDGVFEKNLPTSRSAASVRPVENHGSDFNLPFSQGDEKRPIVERPAVSPVTELPSADSRLRGVERVHDMVSLHSMRLIESKSDTLAVIIKPAVGTELSLELRHRDGVVEAQATLTRGDYQFLSQHWPDLQQRLEQRGIRLQPLAGEGAALANDQGQSHRQPASPEDTAQQASAFAEFASHAGGASARFAPMHDGWESWA